MCLDDFRKYGKEKKRKILIFNDVLTSADIENQIIFKPTSTLKIEK